MNNYRTNKSWWWEISQWIWELISYKRSGEECHWKKSTLFDWRHKGEVRPVAISLNLDVCLARYADTFRQRREQMGLQHRFPVMKIMMAGSLNCTQWRQARRQHWQTSYVHTQPTRAAESMRTGSVKQDTTMCTSSLGWPALFDCCSVEGNQRKNSGHQ